MQFIKTLAMGCGIALVSAPSAQTPATDAASAAPDFKLYRREIKDYKVARWGPDEFETKAYAFRAAKIVPVSGEVIYDGVILTRNKKIRAIGSAREVSIPADHEVIDLGDAWIVPGLVDLHFHIASRSFDLNDSVHATNPEFRTLDLIELDHPQVKNALAGGVTTVLYIPGSGSNSGGFGTLTKLHGTPDEALVRFPGSLKIAQAGNPERRAGDLGVTRMGMNQGLRSMLERGRDYYRAWEAFDAGTGPKPDPRPDLEYLRGLFRHEYPVTVHTQIYQVVLQTLRQLRTEFDLWTVIDHGTFDGFRLSQDARERGVAVCNGPRQYHFDSRTGQFIGCADAWQRGGQHGWLETVLGVGPNGIAINTDSPVVAQEELSLQCAMAVRLGLPWETGIRAVTINPARFIGAADRIGSLEVGKDADFAAWSGDPLDPRSHVKTTIVNGRIAYTRDPNRPRF